MKSFIVIACLLIGSGLLAQKSKKSLVPNLPSFDEKQLHFGFLLGFNAMDFKVVNSGISNDVNDNKPIYGDVIQLQPGINIGIVSNLRLANHLDLRFLPGISFGQRDMYFVYEDGVQDPNPIELKSTFIEFPLLLKYSSIRQNNFKPYAIAGLAGRIDLAKSKQEEIRLKPLDAYFEVGAGIDMYLTYFKFSLELKASYGFNNIINPEVTEEEGELLYTQAIDKLTSNIFHLTFYFE